MVLFQLLEALRAYFHLTACHELVRGGVNTVHVQKRLRHWSLMGDCLGPTITCFLFLSVFFLSAAEERRCSQGPVLPWDCFYKEARSGKLCAWGLSS